MRAFVFAALLGIATVFGTSTVRAESNRGLHRAYTVRVAWDRGRHFGWHGHSVRWHARPSFYPAYRAYYPAYSALYAPAYYDYYYATPYGYTWYYGTPYGHYYWTWRY